MSLIYTDRCGECGRDYPPSLSPFERAAEDIFGSNGLVMKAPEPPDGFGVYVTPGQIKAIYLKGVDYGTSMLSRKLREEQAARERDLATIRELTRQVNEFAHRIDNDPLQARIADLEFRERVALGEARSLKAQLANAIPAAEQAPMTAEEGARRPADVCLLTRCSDKRTHLQHFYDDASLFGHWCPGYTAVAFNGGQA